MATQHKLLGSLLTTCFLLETCAFLNPHIGLSSGLHAFLKRDGRLLARSNVCASRAKCSVLDSLTMGSPSTMPSSNSMENTDGNAQDKASKPIPDDDDLIVPAQPSRLLSERVAMTVSNIRRRMSIFRKYARDIQGKTGLGAIAAFQYVQSVIRGRESVWGDLVMIVMQSKPKQVQELILNTARDILEAPINETEWAWFRDNLLSTFVWFAPSTREPGKYLYHHLLDIATSNIKAQALLVNGKRFRLLEDIPSATYLPGGDDACRQDHRMVGLLPDIREQTLLTAENRQFYDLNVYLNKLICVARVVDPEFQAHLAAVFAPLSPAPAVQPGPPKSLARCRAKAQADYADGAWPTTAHLLDMVRCSITFRHEADLLQGYNRLLAAAAAPDAAAAAAAAAPDAAAPGAGGGGGGGGAVELPAGAGAGRLEVARVKNGFRAGKTGYRDLKVNVVFRPAGLGGAGMVGEVALVLEELVEYRRATHELYEILRERDFFQQVVAELDGFI